MYRKCTHLFHWGFGRILLSKRGKRKKKKKGGKKKKKSRNLERERERERERESITFRPSRIVRFDMSDIPKVKTHKLVTQ